MRAKPRRFHIIYALGGGRISARDIPTDATVVSCTAATTANTAGLRAIAPLGATRIGSPT
jgi:hypothetical protein